MPVLARAGLDDPGVGALFEQAHSPHLDLEHELRHVAREHDVAAPSKNEFRRTAELGMVNHGSHIGVTRDSNQ